MDPEGGSSYAADNEGCANASLPGAAGEAIAGVPHCTQEAAQEQQQQREPALTKSPAERLRQLEKRAGELTGMRSALRSQLAEASGTAYHAAAGRLGTACTAVPMPHDPAALVEELAVVQGVRQYLQYLQELQALGRQVEKLARGAEMEYSGGGDPGALLEAASQAVDAFSNATGYVIALDQLASSGSVPSSRLLRQGSALAGRVQQVGSTLHSVLSATIHQRLHQCSWPPPLSVGADDAAPLPGGAAGGWHGFAAGGEALVGELQQLFTVLLTLQRATQHAQFAALGPPPGADGPVLWPAEELSRGIAERLHHHFAQGLPTDRADKPEWLFAAAVKAAWQCAPPAEAFQPAVDAHELQRWYSMQLEVARAVHAVGVVPLLRGHVLPRLTALADRPGWLHYADSAMQYERQYAPLRGAAAALSGADDDDGAAAAAAAAHPASAIEVLFEAEEWCDGWLAAELWDAQRQLEAAYMAPDAWLPPPTQGLNELQLQLDLGANGNSSSVGSAARVASRHEFWPPACAETAASVVCALVRRGGWVREPEHHQRFVKAVPQAVLRAFRGHLATLLTTAEQFREMLDESWLPRVGAAICAAHYMEHCLRDPLGALLAEQSGGSTASLAAALEREAAALSALRRQWAYKLAKLAVGKFQALFASYRRDFSGFGAGFDPEAPTGRRQAQVHQLPPPAGPSPRLLPAADGLQHMLRALSAHLDVVVFRDVWRAMALAVNYAFFNDVATEAAFSAHGALQLEADCNALLAVFSECTSRPAAHFKESREACRLLLLEEGEAGALAEALHSGQPEALAAQGVRALNAEQAVSVLTQRLDLSVRGQGSYGLAA